MGHSSELIYSKSRQPTPPNEVAQDTFAKMVYAHENVVGISFGIDFLTEAIVRSGFYVSAGYGNL